MTDWAVPLVLASGSARRRDLMAAVGVPIEIDPSDADESIPEGMGAAEAVVVIAERKAADVAVRHPGRAILAADTMVEVDGLPLGKPANREDARRMLKILSGRWHNVFTGVVVIAGGAPYRKAAATRVRMASMTDAEIDRYVSGPEPYDKAGAYGIQAVAGWFVAEVQGSPSNVMGLPLETVRELFAEAGLPLPRLGSPE